MIMNWAGVEGSNFGYFMVLSQHFVKEGNHKKSGYIRTIGWDSTAGPLTYKAGESLSKKFL